MSFSVAYKAAFEKTLGFEGGYVNNPNDPGGETKYGISKRSYPSLDIAALTLNDAMGIYYRDYWTPLKLDQVSAPPLAEEIFDTAVLHGPKLAAGIAQGALILLGVKVDLDGKIGPKTLTALNAFADIPVLLKTMNCLQFTALLVGSDNVEELIGMIRLRLAQLTTFLRGWMKRIEI
jgi:lysozyme family protein